jgi:hypothetical protein
MEINGISRWMGVKKDLNLFFWGGVDGRKDVEILRFGCDFISKTIFIFFNLN